MEKNKSKNIIIILLSLIIVVLGVLCVLFATGKIGNKNIQNNTNVINQSSQNTDNSNNSENQANTINESDYIRQTEVILIKEPDCTGQHSSSLTAAINSNGNIGISQDMGAEEVVVGNAKYLYSVNIIACDNVKLYYITRDNELFVLDHPSSSAINQKGTKVTESKITEFLGIDNRTDGNYLKVLNSNGNVEYYKYFTSPN